MMNKRLALTLLALLFASGVVAAEKVSSVAIGMYRPDDASALTPAFINAVNRYLRRYEPRLIERTDKQVKMQVDYDFIYSIELKVKEREYEIIVTLEQATSRTSKAQGQAAKLVTGVHKTMENFLARNARAR